MRSAGCNSIARPVFGMTEIIPIAPILSSYLWDTTLADYLVGTRKAHYYFTVKGNQPGLLEALEFYFRDRGQPHFVEHTPPDHGRIETRKIWTTTELNSYLDFPHVGQAFVIERHRTDKKSGESSLEISYGLTSRPRKETSPHRRRHTRPRRAEIPADQRKIKKTRPQCKVLTETSQPYNFLQRSVRTNFPCRRPWCRR